MKIYVVQVYILIPDSEILVGHRNSIPCLKPLYMYKDQIAFRLPIQYHAFVSFLRQIFP